MLMDSRYSMEKLVARFGQLGMFVVADVAPAMHEMSDFLADHGRRGNGMVEPIVRPMDELRDALYQQTP